MADFMPHHSGQLGFITEVCKDTAGQIDISAWNCECVDDGRIHNREVPFEIGPVGDSDKLASQRLHVCLQRHILDNPVLLANLRIGLLADRDFLALGNQYNLPLSSNGISGTACENECERHH